MTESSNKERNYINTKINDLEAEIAALKQLSCDEDYFRLRSDKTIRKRTDQLKESKKNSFSTTSLWGLYGREDINQFKSMVLPVFSTTTGSSYDSLLDGSLLLSYQTINDPNKIYSRIDNNTIDHLAMKLAAMEGSTIPELTQGLCVSSGMAAVFVGTMPFLSTNDHFVSSNRVYGGTEQLFNVTYPNMGWHVDWVNEPWDLSQWQEKITNATKFLYVESPSNPTLFIADIPELAKIAHDHDIPLIIDSTIGSPALLRPFEFGADVVIQSVTKIMGSSGRAIAGAIIAKDRIITKNVDLQENFVNKLKGGHFRNLGPCLHPPSAAALWDNLNSLEVRLRHISTSALKIARFLVKHEMIEKVNYPGLETHPQHDLAKKLMKFPDGTNGYSHLLSFNVRGDIETTKQFANRFTFGLQVTDLGRDYTTWVHNASTTHGQMTDEMRRLAGVDNNLIRYSVGLEGPDDAIAALETALDKL
ncbi:MAG: aminotransferase class I/II-fold pyridoxal phosphate-dependent enzyme [Candidatus Kariarchaeaceae archaeon]|jgi:O-acetylhomoserine (thiol)-lyase